MVVAEDGGDCTAGDACSDFFGTEISLSQTPTTVSVRFDELSQEGWGLQVPWKPAEVMMLQWLFKAGYDASGNVIDPLDSFELCVDDVEFF